MARPPRHLRVPRQRGCPSRPARWPIPGVRRSGHGSSGLAQFCSSSERSFGSFDDPRRTADVDPDSAHAASQAALQPIDGAGVAEGFLAFFSVIIAFVSTTPAASLVSSDGFTTLTTQGTVTAGTPYSSGQQITVTVSANSSLSNATLCESQYAALGQTCGNPSGDYYIEECTDPDGLTANVPTTPDGCEHGTEDQSQAKSLNGNFNERASSSSPFPTWSISEHPT